MTRFEKDIKTDIAAHETSIPIRYHHLAYVYPYVSWRQANKFWMYAVAIVKMTYKVGCLNEIPFGKGYEEAGHELERMLKKANRLAEELEKKEKSHYYE